MLNMLLLVLWVHWEAVGTLALSYKKMVETTFLFSDYRWLQLNELRTLI